MTLREALGRVRSIRLGTGSSPVERTVADDLVRHTSPQALFDAPARTPFLTITVARDTTPWFEVGVDSGANVSFSASHGALLFAAARLAGEEWGERRVEEFRTAVRHEVSFRWLRNHSDFLVGSLRHARGFDREAYLCQIARQGFTHVTVNGLGAERPFESGPPGDVYHWFYDYSPDLDQFVDSSLIRGYYPADYRAANLKFLKDTAALALRYGLTPGLHINSPRSMPEEFWHRYGFLRGARVDHPRETLLPRYTLAMAHPAVQQHYRELMRKILAEVPELGFVHLWTNDSGAGFEFVSTLYAGRNGGPYLIREWKNHEEIARKAADNVLTYFHLLRDEGRRINPDFRLVCDLGPFKDERPGIVAGMGEGIDAGDFAYFEGTATESDREQLQKRGARTHVKVDVGENNFLGFPSPRLVYERLSSLRARGGRYALTGGTPVSLAPFDINGEVVRAFQLTPERPLQDVLHYWARKWAEERWSTQLRELWDMADNVMGHFPPGVPMSTFGFPWFRLWVRPLVPNIDAIPEDERLYYEDFLLATFNNPARIDLNNDMLWNFLSVREAGEKKQAIDGQVLPPLDTAIDCCRDLLAGTEGIPALFSDLFDRLRVGRCYCRTMRNVLAWIESVHGYGQATQSAEKALSLARCRDMVDNELNNVRELQALWQSGRTHFMPVSARGETLHIYGENFGDLLAKKIELMERYGNAEPVVDPHYMWRMHGNVPAL